MSAVLRTRFLVYFIILINILQSVLADGDKAELKFVLDKLIEEVKSDDLTSNLSWKKQGNDVLINGEVKQTVDMDNDWKVSVEILRSEKSDGEYETMMTMPEKGVCDICKSYYKTYFYPSLKNHANVPDPEKCPVTSETYIVKDYPVDSSKFKKFLKPGQYRVVIKFFKDGVKKNEYIIEGHVEEDK